MRIEIINTGTELLFGNTINTHAAWFGQELFKLGLRIARQTTVPDGEASREAIAEAVGRADVVLVTGGLGPTSDDLTREITAEVMGLELITDEAALRSLEAFFTLRNKPMAASNLKQALSPVGADILPNPHGTAPGIYIPPRLNGRANCAVFLLPGPPRELYPMFHGEVVPRLKSLAGLELVHHALELKFAGIGESDFHEGVDAALAAIEGLEYGYCAHIGEVDLRLIGVPEVLEIGRKAALERYAANLISENGASLEKTVVDLLAAHRKTLAVVESCTGGLISHRITNIPGSSAVFGFGYVTYSNTAKTQLLGVSAGDITTEGAVSETVARQMAEGALLESGADLAVAVTGIAGPGGGTETKPVGTAWVALAVKGGETTTQKIFHPREREDFKLSASQSALEMVRRKLRSLEVV
ncbi:MAG: competence/damage-inducible protein A [Luteolibacter sp.]